MAPSGKPSSYRSNRSQTRELCQLNCNFLYSYLYPFDTKEAIWLICLQASLDTEKLLAWCEEEPIQLIRFQCFFTFVNIARNGIWLYQRSAIPEDMQSFPSLSKKLLIVYFCPDRNDVVCMFPCREARPLCLQPVSEWGNMFPLHREVQV